MESSKTALSYRPNMCRLSGERIELPSLCPDDTVSDLAHSVRANMGIPISVQKLVWGDIDLKDPSKKLSCVFGEVVEPEISVLRRPFSPQERLELHRRLIRATAAGKVSEARELLKEGAQVNFEPVTSDVDVSASLSRWGEDVDNVMAAKCLGHFLQVPGTQVYEMKGNDRIQEEPHADEDTEEELEEVDEGDHGMDVDDIGKKMSEDCQVQIAISPTHPCGGLDPYSMALAVGEVELAQDFKELGAHDVDLKPKAGGGLHEAFVRHDFEDVMRHLVQGADPNTRLPRGMPGSLDIWSIWPSADPSFANPLHACAGLHKCPGAYETAQLLIRMRADLNAGDAEGDTPLAHALYFKAPGEFHDLYRGMGAKLEGPFYARFQQ